MSISDEIRFSDHVSVLKRTEGKATGFSESERQGRTSWADQTKDGVQSFSIVGTPPQGEEDTLSACRVLVEYLNSHGGHWQCLQQGKGDVDCLATDAQDPSRHLSIQVVRASVDSPFWRELQKQGKTERANVPLTELISLVQTAIAKKTDNAKIPPRARPNIHLALDATRLPGLAFDDVVAEFKKQHRTWVHKHGFAGVWLVGPSIDLTWRLDD